MTNKEEPEKSSGEQVADLNREQIEELIPHRGAMLLLDSAVICGGGTPAVFGKYYVSSDNLFVQGHFLGRPVFPGFMTIEALAQAAAILYSFFHPEDRGKDFFLLSADSLRFRHPVAPDQFLYLQAQIDREANVAGQVIAKFSAKAHIIGDDGRKIDAAEGKMSGIILPRQ